MSIIKTAYPSEHQEQVKFISWFKRTYPDIKIAAIPNGGHRHKVTAMKMKMEGQSKGFPDLFIPELKLFIEMKRQKGGTLSPEQKGWINYLKECGYQAEVCKGCEIAKQIVISNINNK